MKKLILFIIVLFVGFIFLSCELQDDGSMKLGGNHNDISATKENINVKHTQSDSSNIVMMSVTSPASWTEEYKTFYRKVKKKELKKIDTTLKSTNTFWSYIKSKGFNVSNVRILKSEEVVSMPWPKSKEEAVKKINYGNNLYEKKICPYYIHADYEENIYLHSFGYKNRFRYIKKYNKNGKYLFSILYTTNTGPHYDKYYFALKSIYVDKMEHLYCYGWVSAKIWGSSKGVKEYNKEGQLVKQGIVKKGYYVNSKGEKISELELIGRGYRKKYKLKRSFIINKSLFKWWLEIKIFNYQIKKQKFHSYIINRCGQFETFFIDKYGTTYCIYKKRKTNDMYFGNDFPIPNIYGYILIVSPVEKGGRLLGVVPIIDNGDGFVKQDIQDIITITQEGRIYYVYANFNGLKIFKYRIYNNK